MVSKLETSDRNPLKSLDKPSGGTVMKAEF